MGLDPETGAVLHVGDGKVANVLKPFVRRLMRCGVKIEAVAIDMYPSFISAETRHISAAKIVFDRFHVIKLMKEHLSKFRRALYLEVSREMKGCLKAYAGYCSKNRITSARASRSRNFSKTPSGVTPLWLLPTI